MRYQHPRKYDVTLVEGYLFAEMTKEVQLPELHRLLLLIFIQFYPHDEVPEVSLCIQRMSCRPASTGVGIASNCAAADSRSQ